MSDYWNRNLVYGNEDYPSYASDYYGRSGYSIQVSDDGYDTSEVATSPDEPDGNGAVDTNNHQQCFESYGQATACRAYHPIFEKALEVPLDTRLRPATWGHQPWGHQSWGHQSSEAHSFNRTQEREKYYYEDQMENLLQGYGDDAFPYPFEDRFPKENSSFAHRLKTVNSSVDPRPRPPQPWAPSQPSPESHKRGRSRALLSAPSQWNPVALSRSRAVKAEPRKRTRPNKKDGNSRRGPASATVDEACLCNDANPRDPFRFCKFSKTSRTADPILYVTCTRCNQSTIPFSSFNGHNYQ